LPENNYIQKQQQNLSQSILCSSVCEFFLFVLICCLTALPCSLLKNYKIIDRGKNNILYLKTIRQLNSLSLLSDSVYEIFFLVNFDFSHLALHVLKKYW